MSAPVRLLGALALLSVSGCTELPTELPVVCTLELRYGINVTVVDSITGSPPDEATLIATATGFADTVGPAKPFQATANGPLVIVLSTAGERPGIYSLVVRSPEYRDWTRNNVEVTADQCHVRPVALTAKLQAR